MSSTRSIECRAVRKMGRGGELKEGLCVGVLYVLVGEEEEGDDLYSCFCCSVSFLTCEGSFMAGNRSTSCSVKNTHNHRKKRADASAKPYRLRDVVHLKKGRGRACACLDVDVVGEEHGHAVDAHTPTGGGRKTILERRAEHIVDELSLIVTLLHKDSSDRGDGKSHVMIEFEER
jgi:hypothetical protein